MGENKYLIFDPESYSGSGYIIIDVSMDPKVLRTENEGANPIVVDIEDLESTEISQMIKEARDIFSLSKKEYIYVDVDGLLDTNYIASEEHLYEPNNYSPLDYDEDDLNDFADYCDKL